MGDRSLEGHLVGLGLWELFSYGNRDVSRVIDEYILRKGGHAFLAWKWTTGSSLG